MRQIRIISDGTPQGTKLLDENGKVIFGVTGVSLEIEAAQVPRATVSFACPITNVVANCDGLLSADQEKKIRTLMADVKKSGRVQFLEHDMIALLLNEIDYLRAQLTEKGRELKAVTEISENLRAEGR